MITSSLTHCKTDIEMSRKYLCVHRHIKRGTDIWLQFKQDWVHKRGIERVLTGKLAFSKTGNIGRKKLILLNIPFVLYNNYVHPGVGGWGGGFGHIIFTFSGVPASHLVSRHFRQQFLSYLYQIWHAGLLG